MGTDVKLHVRKLVGDAMVCENCGHTSGGPQKLKKKLRTYMPPKRGAAYVARSAAKKKTRIWRPSRRRAWGPF